MAGPGGKEVGRVSVRVVPDTERFRRDLERSLKREAAGISVTVEVKPDVAGFRAAVKAMTKGLEVKAKVVVDDDAMKNVKKTDRIVVKADVDVDSSSLKAAKAEYDAFMPPAHKSIYVDVDRDSLKRVEKEVTDTVRNVTKHKDGLFDLGAGGKIKLSDLIDYSDEELDDIAKQIGKSRFELVLEIEKAKADAEMAAFREKNDHLTVDVTTEKLNGVSSGHDSVHVRVDADTALAEMKIDKVARDRHTNLKVDVDKSKVGMLTSVMDKLKDMANPSTGLMGKMGGGGDISQLLLIVAVILLIAPAIAIVATLLAGIPALIAGIGIAFGALYLGVDGFMTAFAAIGPQMKQMTTSVSATVAEVFTPMFAQLADAGVRLLPVLNQVVGGFGRMAQGITNALTSSGGMLMLEEITEHTNELFTRLGPTMNKLTTTFLNLANLGAQSFGTLAQTFDDFAVKFQGWTDKLGADNVLPGAFQGLSQAFDGLGTLFFNLMDIGVRSMEELGPYVKTFFEDVGTLLQSLAPFFSTMFKWFGTLFNGFTKMLAPVLTKLAPIFDRLMMAGAKLGSALMESLGTAMVPIVESLGNGLLAVMNALKPVLPEITMGIQQMGVALGESFKKNAPMIAESFAKLAESLAVLAPKIADLLPKLLQIGIDAFPKIIEALPELVSSFVNLANSGAIEKITQALIDLAPHLPMIISGFTKLAVMGASLSATIIGLAAGFAGMTGAVGGFFFGIETKILSFMGRMLAIPMNIINGFTDAFSNGGGLISNVLEGIWNGIIASAKGIFGIHSPSTVFNDIGVNIIQGLIDGLQNTVGRLMALVAEIAGKVSSAFKNVLGIHSPSRVFIDIGDNVNAGFAKGLKRTEYEGVDAAKGAAQRAIEAYKREWQKEHRKKGEKTPEYAGPELKVEVRPKPLSDRVKSEWDRTLKEDFKDIGKNLGTAWTDSLLGDLGFSQDGAIGNLIDQVFDPKVKLEEQKDVYVVKDVAAAERNSDVRKKKNALRTTGGMPK